MPAWIDRQTSSDTKSDWRSYHLSLRELPPVRSRFVNTRNSLRNAIRSCEQSPPLLSRAAHADASCERDRRNHVFPPASLAGTRGEQRGLVCQAGRGADVHASTGADPARAGSRVDRIRRSFKVGGAWRADVGEGHGSWQRRIRHCRRRLVAGGRRGLFQRHGRMTQPQGAFK